MPEIGIEINSIDDSINIGYKIIDGVSNFLHGDRLSYCKFFHLLI